MGSSVVETAPRLAVALVALTAVAAIGGRLSGLGQHRDVVVAALRATAQLAAVSAVLLLVARSLPLTAAFVLVMLTVAAVTSAGRATGHRLRDPGAARRIAAAAVPLAAGAAPVLALVLATGAVPLRGVAVIPVAGILIGGAMTATSLAGRRMRDELTLRWNELEGALALGARRQVAVLLIGRPGAATALVPALDQTRTVGLVTLPGAFVGVLLGGGSPLQAGAAQLLVLIGLLAAEVIAVWVVTELVARGRLLDEVPRQVIQESHSRSPAPDQGTVGQWTQRQRQRPDGRVGKGRVP